MARTSGNGRNDRDIARERRLRSERRQQRGSSSKPDIKVTRKQPERPEKEVKPFNVAPWVPVVIIAGFVIGFAVCCITFAYLGGN